MSVTAKGSVPAPTAAQGIGFMALAVALFAVMDVLIKWLSAAGYPTLQLVFFRSLFAFLPLGLFVLQQRRLRAALAAAVRPPRHIGDHLLRCTAGFGSMLCFFYAFGEMPLADVIAIGFAAPLFMTVLSILMLGEVVRLHRWSAVLVGFAGVLLMIRPGPDVLGGAASIALLATLLYAVAMIYVRKLSRTESAIAIVFYFTLFSTVGSGIAMPFLWVTPGPADAAMLVAMGLLGGTAQLCMTQAYRLAPIAVVAPFDYTGMLWGCLFGWLVWSELPVGTTIVGAAIVTASGLYILHRETRRSAPVPPPATVRRPT